MPEVPQVPARVSSEAAVTAGSLSKLVPPPDVSLYSEATRRLAAVHQAGVATVYLGAWLRVPSKITVQFAGSEAHYFNEFPESPVDNDRYVYMHELENDVAVTVAGGMAESLVLGQKSFQAEHEMAAASDLSANVLARHRMAWNRFQTYSVGADGRTAVNTTEYRQLLNEQSSDLLGKTTQKAVAILVKEKRFFQALARLLLEKPDVGPDELKALLESHWSDPEEVKKILAPALPATLCDQRLTDFLVDRDVFSFQTPDELVMFGIHARARLP